MIFLAHAYLTAGMPVPGDIALRVIDEKFFAGLLVENSISSENWFREREVSAAGGQDERRAGLAAACGLVFEALKSGCPVNDSLRKAGYERRDITAFREHELAAAPTLVIHPQMRAVDQRDLVDGFSIRELRIARARARVWQAIHGSWDRPSSERLTIEKVGTDDGEHYRIWVQRRDDINREIPTIVLDADADPAIVETFRPGARFVSLDVAPNAEVIQIRDRTFSNASLLTGPKAEALREQVRTVIEREVASSPRGVLFVATQDVLRQLHRDVDPTCSVENPDDLMRPLLGAHPRWFGPRLQGVNTYKDFETVILLGRLEPPAAAIDTQLRSLAADGDRPLAFAASASGACGWFPEQEGWYLRRDGAFEAGKVQHHPDPRGAALLAQNREAHLLQAMARIRAVGSQTRKRLVILCSIPLPRLPVDRLLCWHEFVTGASEKMFRKINGLRRAIRLPDGTMTKGLRLSVDGLVADAPHAFPEPWMAAEWRRGLPTDQILEVVNRTLPLEDARMTLVSLLRFGGGGKPTPALVEVSGSDPLESARERWPGLVPVHWESAGTQNRSMT